MGKKRGKMQRDRQTSPTGCPPPRKRYCGFRWAPCNGEANEWSPWLGVLGALVQFVNVVRGIFQYLGQIDKYMGGNHMRNIHSIFSYSCHQTLHIPYHYFNAGTKDTYCLNLVVENAPAPFAADTPSLSELWLASLCLLSAQAWALFHWLGTYMSYCTPLFIFKFVWKLVYINYIARWVLWKQFS